MIAPTRKNVVNIAMNMITNHVFGEAGCEGSYSPTQSIIPRS